MVSDALTLVVRGLLGLDPRELAGVQLDQGVAVGMTYRLPFEQSNNIGPFVRAALPRIDDLVTEVESQLRS